MLVPGLTITMIGLAVGVVTGVILQHGPAPRSVLGGVIGAWAGFAAGALIAWLADPVLPGGYYGLLFGHAFAVLGALGFVMKPVRSLSDSRH
ncbi:hypothetical protein JK358_23505 [Nocardia sp. 2]|uniref:GlsB/YeaQ/YmgE family stress response membrane protein n=1 Tax=Nocardia acididurans TaxID=2802282 RepID=A0ABS1M9Q0_9NOCA|nr:hypothetical protein [Nocardia acididurans]MBL1077373.1 hypothetical protein [Nocardia acididurans]